MIFTYYFVIFLNHLQTEYETHLIIYIHQGILKLLFSDNNSINNYLKM